jgi:hypothetical protein
MHRAGPKLVFFVRISRDRRGAFAPFGFVSPAKQKSSGSKRDNDCRRNHQPPSKILAIIFIAISHSIFL